MAYTNRRLTQAYHEAKVKYFDENSKIIFFSDSHRGDDSLSDEFIRNQTLMLGALQYYYKEGFTYIENGDGDDLWEHAHFKHIRAAHTDIFTIMKKFYDAGRYIMIYGNHNIFMRNRLYVKAYYYYFHDEYKDEDVELFKGIRPIESLVLKQKKTGQEILVLHGHQGDLMNDQLWFVNMLLLRYFWRFMHVVGFRNPASPAKNQAKRHKVEKQYTKWIAKHRMMLICGHTHRMKFPKKGQLPYFNSGCCIHTKGISGIEIQNNEIMLVQWRVEADDSGVLRIRRHVIRGPEPVEKFDMR
ncbi:MAG: serine/threonine protein phosphatase [Lachnospiraceae bacterium]|nr:serine/threonine protein phosphatase [Lachnospiraceae bacterium]